MQKAALTPRPSCGPAPRHLLRRGVISAALLVAVAACGTSAGSALETGDTEQTGLSTIRTGTEIGIDFSFVRNITGAPITLLSAEPVGRGIGTVIRPVEIKIAFGLNSIPRSGYIEDPPVVNYGRGRCGVQSLGEVHGAVLSPGLHHAVTIWTVLLGIRPGRYNVTAQVITYTQAGTHYQQTIKHGYFGRVTRHAPLLRATQDGSRPCLHLTHLLKGTLP